MSPDDDRDLRELSQLPKTGEPPPALEERVVGALRQRGLLGEAPADAPRALLVRRWALAASVVLALLVGWHARAWVEPVDAPAVTERQFMVLLSEPRDLETTKPMAELIAEYRDWAMSLAERDRLVTAARLEHDGVRLAASPEGEVQRLEADWRQATGYFVIRADSYDEAERLIADCPHLVYGGEISLRQLANGA